MTDALFEHGKVIIKHPDWDKAIAEIESKKCPKCGEDLTRLKGKYCNGWNCCHCGYNTGQFNFKARRD